MRITRTWFSSSIDLDVFVMAGSTRSTCAAIDADWALGNGMRVENANGVEASDVDERRSADITKNSDTLSTL